MARGAQRRVPYGLPALTLSPQYFSLLTLFGSEIDVMQPIMGLHLENCIHESFISNTKKVLKPTPIRWTRQKETYTN